jgi:hypothetical protein
MKFILILFIPYIISVKIDDYNTNNKIKSKSILNVQVDQPDREPLEIKRIDEEKRMERERVRDLEIIEEADKKNFQKIINEQNKLLNKLSSIADKTTKMIEEVMKNPLAKLRKCDKRPKSYSFKSLPNGPIF